MADKRTSIILSIGAFILLLVVSQAVPVTDSSKSESEEEEKATESTENHQESNSMNVIGSEEMDIILSPEQEAYFDREQGSKHRRKRKIFEKKDKRWPMPILYKFDKSCTPERREQIRGALSHWQDQTCIHFFEVNDSAQIGTHHLIFTSYGSRCGSFVGKIDFSNMEPQKINLPEKCLKKFGTAVHEIGHALGLWHEHQRPDRDGHIEVVNDNLVQWAHGNFDQAPSDYVDHYGLPYDYNSIMHYGATAGSVNGAPTLRTRDGLYQKNIGQRVEISFLDAKVVNRAYCKAICSVPLTRECKHGGYQDPKDCSRCRCPDGLAGRYCEDLSPSTNGLCGGTINMGSDTTVTLTSPGYSDHQPYENRVNCNWLVKAPRGHTVEFMFLGDFSIFCHANICYHWVEVRYKSNFEAPGPRFCCSHRPHHLIESEGEEMLVIFRTNWTSTVTEERRGFHAILHAKPHSDEDANRVEGLFASRFRTSSSRSEDNYHGDSSDPGEEVMTADRHKVTVMSTTTSTTTQKSTTPSTTPTTTQKTTTTTTTTTTTEKPAITKRTTEAMSTERAKKRSSTDAALIDYTWTEWTPCSGPVECKCGGCSYQNRRRLCDGAECPRALTVSQHRRCSRKCTKEDIFKRYIGRMYTVQCPTCCPGYKLSGNICVPWRRL